MLLHPQAPTIFVEVKKIGGKVSPVQQFRHEQLRAKGFDVRVVDPTDWPLSKSEWQCVNAYPSLLDPSVSGSAAAP